MESTIILGFNELTTEEMLLVNGGGALWKALVATAGAVCISVAPVVGILAGMGASVVGTPIIGAAAGVGAAATLVSAGASMLDWATSK